ncbi:type IV secretion/conjugal transfer VirB4 family ATPase [Sphingobium sp. OAS761]|nr:type IV secretion/conjugal transfer VirB4 family ATPase [Sphingobium sp. OAS761]
MTDSVQTRSTGLASGEIHVPLNKLKKSPRNARKVPHGEAAIEALAASIQHKGLIQNLVVEPEVKEDGTPTGNYLVTAGEGRRLAMLLRAKRKQIKKSEAVRCWLDTANDPAEISLDENVTRTPMHPADQFERFRELADGKGWGAEEIGARFGVSAGVVKQRLRLWDRDPAVAAEKLRLAEKVIQGRDFTVIPEGMNAIEAWLGSLPGHAYANVRQPPISTLNLAHLIPLSAVWAGPERDEHLQAPPLLFGKTEGSTPFRFSLHVGDVGHALIVGPTGAGKSVLLALMAMQFCRYANAQVFAFDFGGSIRAAALGMGGDWQDLGGMLADEAGEGVQLQPLAHIDDPAERAWAAEWLAAIFASEGVAVDPQAKEHIWSALGSLASAPVSERTLTGLAVLLQSQPLKQALGTYCVGGPWGRLLDAEAERIGEARCQAFETEGLVGAGAAAAVLSYLFHRIGDRLDGSPTLIIIDEGWLVLDSPAFAAQLREWLKTLRKKNASVVFATQSLADIETSSIAPAIIESCPTRIFLPNERAAEPQIAAIYERFGLNARQIEILSRATPKRDYYCQSRRGNRLFELGLGEVALAFAAASSKSDQLAIAEIIETHGAAAFAAEWLRYRGCAWAAELLPDPASGLQPELPLTPDMEIIP